MTTTVGATDVDELWREYASERSPEVRAQLIEAHIPLVRYVASRMIGRLHASVEHQDLVSYGVFGLMDAIERFDVDAGTKFSTFATYRIQGAINDEMRAQAWEPRNVRARFRRVQEAVTELEHELLRAPTESEVATHVGIDVAELRRIEHDMRVSVRASLSAPVGEDGTELGELVAGEDLGDLPPQVSEMAALLASAMYRLPTNERVLLQLIYVEHLTFKHIAQVLQVTESWVSHLHTRAMVRVQRTMSAQY